MGNSKDNLLNGDISAEKGPATDNSSQVQLEYAGFWIRFFAFSVDIMIVSMIILFVILTLLGFTYLYFEYFPSPTSQETEPKGGLGIFGVLLIIHSIISLSIFQIYSLLFLSSKWCATPGKRMFNLYVLNNQNKPLTFWRVFLREIIGKLIANLFGNIGSIIGVFGFIMIAFRNDKKGLHDLMAKTQVFIGKAEDHPL